MPQGADDSGGGARRARSAPPLLQNGALDPLLGKEVGDGAPDHSTANDGYVGCLGHPIPSSRAISWRTHRSPQWHHAVKDVHGYATLEEIRCIPTQNSSLRRE